MILYINPPFIHISLAKENIHLESCTVQTRFRTGQAQEQKETPKEQNRLIERCLITHLALLSSITWYFGNSLIEHSIYTVPIPCLKSTHQRSKQQELKEESAIADHLDS